MRKNSSALNGIRVLSLEHVLAVPYGTMVLADLGAEVVKVERPGIGDDSRQYGPFINGESGYFISINRNKKSITLDYSKEKGRQIFKELVKTSDVVVENFRPGTLKKYKLSYDDLKMVRPDIIYASVSAFGHDAAPEYQNMAGYDIIAQAVGGIMDITGESDGPPTRVGASIGDITSGLTLAIGILSALHKRDKTGEGSKLDIAMMDVVASILENAIVRYTVTGNVPQRVGNQHPSIAPFDSFQAADGWVIIAIGNDSLWQRFCQAACMTDIVDDSRFQTNEKRSQNYAQLRVLIAEWVSHNRASVVIDLLTKSGVPVSSINTIADVVQHSNMDYRNMFVNVEQPFAGSVKISNTPLWFSLAPEGARHEPAPLLGQHTDEVLRELLGYTVKQTEELKKSGII